MSVSECVELGPNDLPYGHRVKSLQIFSFLGGGITLWFSLSVTRRGLLMLGQDRETVSPLDRRGEGVNGESSLQRK